MNVKCLVYSWAGFNDLESTSPYCLKAIYAARYLKIPLEIKYVNGTPSWALRNALPVAEINGKKIEDSTEILEHLNSLNGESKLYPKDHILDAQVWEDWADENLRYPLVYFRWIHELNWPLFKNSAFGSMPAAVRVIILPIIRRKIRDFLKNQGYLQRPDADKIDSLARTIKLIDERLKKQPFLLNTQEPTAADISVYSFIVSMLSTNPPQLRPIFSDKTGLKSWMQAMMKLVE